jgi:hypothetical protein
VAVATASGSISIVMAPIVMATLFLRLVYGEGTGESSARVRRPRDPRRRGSAFSGMIPRIVPVTTPNGILLWQDGRVVVTAEWDTDPRYWSADERIAGGSVYTTASDSWQAVLLQSHGFTLVPIS